MSCNFIQLFVTIRGLIHRRNVFLLFGNQGTTREWFYGKSHETLTLSWTLIFHFIYVVTDDRKNFIWPWKVCFIALLWRPVYHYFGLAIRRGQSRGRSEAFMPKLPPSPSPPTRITRRKSWRLKIFAKQSRSVVCTYCFVRDTIECTTDSRAIYTE